MCVGEKERERQKEREAFCSHRELQLCCFLKSVCPAGSKTEAGVSMFKDEIGSSFLFLKGEKFRFRSFSLKTE